MVNTNRAYRPVEQQDFIVTDMTLSQIAEYIQELIAEWGPTATVAERWHPFEEESDRKSTRLNSSHSQQSRMPSSA